MLPGSWAAISTILLVDARPLEVKTYIRATSDSCGRVDGPLNKTTSPALEAQTPPNGSYSSAEDSECQEPTWSHFKPTALDCFFKGRATTIIMRDHHSKQLGDTDLNTRDNHLKYTQFISQACKDIFDSVELEPQHIGIPFFAPRPTKQANPWESKISCIEIRDEKVYDLLTAPTDTCQPIVLIDYATTKQNAHFPEYHKTPVNNVDEITKLLVQANTSGESHLVLSLYLTRKDNLGIEVSRQFNFIYLTHCKELTNDHAMDITDFNQSLSALSRSSVVPNASSHFGQDTSRLAPYIINPGPSLDVSYLFESRTIDENIKRFLIDYIYPKESNNGHTLEKIDSSISLKCKVSQIANDCPNGDFKQSESHHGLEETCITDGENAVIEANDDLTIPYSEYLALYNLVSSLKSEILSSRKAIKYYTGLNSLAVSKRQNIANLTAETQSLSGSPKFRKSHRIWKSVDLENEKESFIKHTEFVIKEELTPPPSSAHPHSEDPIIKSSEKIRPPSSTNKVIFSTIGASEIGQREKNKLRAQTQQTVLLCGAIMVWTLAFLFGIIFFFSKRKLSNFARTRQQK